MITDTQTEDSPEAEELQHEQLRESVARGVELAQNTVNTNHGPETANPHDQLEFHIWNHSEDIMRRTQLIIDVIREVSGDELITEREAIVARLLAAHHDTVQNYTLEDKEVDGRTIPMRMRHLGKNEEASADGVVAFMVTENTSSESGELYTDDDMRHCWETIVGTVPAWSSELGTVIQPNRQDNPDRLFVEVIPLADLDGSGIDGAEVSIRDGDQLLVEENREVARLLSSNEPLSDSDKQWIKNRALETTRTQISFIAGRQNALDDDLGKFPHKVAEALKTRVFNRFEESIAAVSEALERRTNASADEVIAELRSSLFVQVAA